VPFINSLGREIKNPLLSTIVVEIEANGPMLFSRFMEMALYHPDYGYYVSDLSAVGKSGDFVTSVSCGDVFGSLLCERFLDWSSESSEFERDGSRWIEVGAHNGQLAKDILSYCREARPDRYRNVQYEIIEPSQTRMAAQMDLLADHLPRIRWRRSWNEYSPRSVRGVIFSNELLDSFPVDRISWNAAQKTWFLWSVTFMNGELAWIKTPLSCSLRRQEFIDSVPEELLTHLPDGFTTELGTAACDWWRDAANRLDRGRLLAIDYGLRREDFFAPHRHEGTLRAYSQHRQNTDLLQNPGKQDLTSHVNFSAIESTGESVGLTSVGLESQESFLTKILQRLVKRTPDSSFLDPKRIRQLQSLIHPSHFGRSFSVLVQKR
jgi:SAM-dependent MidA family methyltransferase